MLIVHVSITVTVLYTTLCNGNLYCSLKLTPPQHEEGAHYVSRSTSSSPSPGLNCATDHPDALASSPSSSNWPLRVRFCVLPTSPSSVSKCAPGSRLFACSSKSTETVCFPAHPDLFFCCLKHGRDRSLRAFHLCIPLRAQVLRILSRYIHTSK